MCAMAHVPRALIDHCGLQRARAVHAARASACAVSERMTIALIVAVAENGVIGRDGGLPWRLSGDLRYFKSVTMGKPIIMGRKTFESIGRPLPGRPNLVVSRNPEFRPEGVEVFGSLEAAVAHAETLPGDEAMVIGGAGLYEAALAIAGGE